MAADAQEDVGETGRIMGRAARGSTPRRRRESWWLVLDGVIEQRLDGGELALLDELHRFAVGELDYWRRGLGLGGVVAVSDMGVPPMASRVRAPRLMACAQGA